MAVVQHDERAVDFDRVEATGRMLRVGAEREQARPDGVLVDPERPRSSGGRQGVLDVEANPAATGQGHVGHRCDEDLAAAAGQAVTQPGHPIQGGGYAIPDLDFLKGVPVDGYLQVSGAQARETTRLLARTEGIFGGFSSGANVAAALQLLRGEMAGKTIAVVICDSGLKYLSTDLWT